MEQGREVEELAGKSFSKTRSQDSRGDEKDSNWFGRKSDMVIREIHCKEGGGPFSVAHVLPNINDD